MDRVTVNQFRCDPEGWKDLQKLSVWQLTKRMVVPSTGPCCVASSPKLLPPWRLKYRRFSNLRGHILHGFVAYAVSNSPRRGVGLSTGEQKPCAQIRRSLVPLSNSCA